uniref:C-type lectin domain-containing protein n=1 Tax=Anopheles epiroticus TaxID=199890 RepID=A0A182PNX5_9DIPT
MKDVNNFPVNGLPPLTYSSKKYTFHIEFVTFFQAWNRCRDMGKRLASIESYQDNLAYREAVAPYAGFEITFWIAATNIGARSNDQSKYYWITTDRPVGYVSGFENWFLGFVPDSANQCVATYLGSALWLTGPCATAVSAYACEESQDV